MDRLEQIKNEVVQEEGIYRDWESYIDDQPYGASDYMVNEVARRYATEVARHNLERAAEQNKDLAVDADNEAERSEINKLYLKITGSAGRRVVLPEE